MSKANMGIIRKKKKEIREKFSREAYHKSLVEEAHDCNIENLSNLNKDLGKLQFIITDQYRMVSPIDIGPWNVKIYLYDYGYVVELHDSKFDFIYKSKPFILSDKYFGQNRLLLEEEMRKIHGRNALRCNFEFRYIDYNETRYGDMNVPVISKNTFKSRIPKVLDFINKLYV